MNQKRVAILGSTGSIGRSALEVIRHLSETHRAVALSANTQIDALIEQVGQYRPAAVAIIDEEQAVRVRRTFLQNGFDTEVLVGSDGLIGIAQREDVDIVLSAVVGAAGLSPAFAAVRAGKTLALANKEALVVAGSLLIAEAAARNVQILPVDSEHSAIFQALRSGRLSEIKRVILTASGGPFRTWPAERMRNATPADALNHPTWQMGAKITVDCATMFNKALEIIEACWLFDLPPEKVEVVIHPESIIHSMVEFVDGSTIAQLSPPDMRTPIQFALTFPDRLPGVGRRLDFHQPLAMHFEPPDLEKFRAIKLAYEVVQLKGTSGAILNAANEVAVAAFLAGRIPLGVICDTVERTIALHRIGRAPDSAGQTLDAMLSADKWARKNASALIDEASAANLQALIPDRRSHDVFRTT